MKKGATKQKILIADDDRDLAHTLKIWLEDKGYEILLAYGGLQAVELALSERPDLILLDYNMPEGSGLVVLNNLREFLKDKMMPVIIITGVKMYNLDELLKNAGARDFVVKPYEEEDLLTKIRALLR